MCGEKLPLWLATGNPDRGCRTSSRRFPISSDLDNNFTGRYRRRGANRGPTLQADIRRNRAESHMGRIDRQPEQLIPRR